MLDVEVFVVEEGPAEAPPLLLLHGFPSCSYDFHRVLPRLAERHRVIAHDHPGFGLSAKPANAAYSLLEQAEVALALWRRLGVRRGHLIAHDYGTSVATEVLARRERLGIPVELASVALCNGSVHLELAAVTRSQRLLKHPLVGPLFARLVGRRFFLARMRSLWGDEERLDPADLEVLWEAVERHGGRRVLPAVSRYLDERVRFARRWIGALERLDLPTLVLWGDRDPVARPAIAERLAAEIPRARLEWLEGIGHYPMLEAPEAWAGAILAHVASAETAQRA